MMEFIQRRLVALIVSLALGLASIPASAEQITDNALENERPSASAMLADAILARPMLLALTAAGTALFVISLPFSALGGNTAEASKTLVIGPAKTTFLRCLGCTESQDRWKDVDSAPVAQQ